MDPVGCSGEHPFNKKNQITLVNLRKMFRALTKTGCKKDYRNAFFHTGRAFDAQNQYVARACARRQYGLMHGYKGFSFNSKKQYNNSGITENISRKDNNEQSKEMWNISSWLMAAASILAYLLIRSKASADAEENSEDVSSKDLTKSISVTKENFKAIKIQLAQNDPAITSLEIQFILTEEELQELNLAIQGNTELGYISWQKGQPSKQILQKIETKLIDNNKNYRKHPNDYIHALLSTHAYRNSKEGAKVELGQSVQQYLENWQVAKVYDDTKNSGYYGVIYINEKTHQVVLANRGTEGIIAGLLSQNSDWKTNFEEILGGKIIIGQQARNYEATYEAVELAKKKNYRLSITGHSLGAWLAELSAFYCHAYFGYRNIKAVTFDSPGTLPMMKQLQSNIRSKDTDIDYNDLDITTYLAAPNPANSCNSHVGKVYRVGRTMEWSDWTKSVLPDFINDILKNKVQGVLTIEGHFLAGILATFDPGTGKPKECHRMADWPRMKYSGDAKSFAEQGKTVAKSATNLVNMSPAAKIALNLGVDYVIGDTTLMTVIGFLKNIINIDQEQYWAYFEYIDSEENDKATTAKGKIKYDNRFALIAKAKYRQDDIDIMNLRKGSVDEYLYELEKCKGNSERLKELPEIVKTQLDDLLSIFKINQIADGKYSLVPNRGHDIEEIRQRMERLLHVAPRNIFDILGTIIINQQTIVRITNGNVKIEFDRVTFLPSNLPWQTLNFTEIRDKEKELEDKMAIKQVVLISGIGGMGKSTLAEKYGKDKKDEGWQVRWIKATNATLIDEQFSELAEDLNISTAGLAPKKIRGFVCTGLEQLQKQQVLFIFDNVDLNGQKKIKKYLDKLPSWTKVVITSRNGKILEGDERLEHVIVDGFDRPQAISYLKEALKKNDQEAAKLVDIVGESPFRLSKTVAYFKNNSLSTVDKFIEEYMAIKKGDVQNNEIYPEVELLFQDLKKKSPESWKLLQYLAYLDPEGVPLELANRLMKKSLTELQPYANDLEHLSLLNVKSEGDKKVLKVSHRIVQEETKKALNEEDKAQNQKILEKLIEEIDKEFPTVNEDPHNWKEAAQWINHAQLLVEETKKIRIRKDLESKIGDYFYYVSFNNNKAIDFWQQFLDHEKSISQESPIIAQLLDSIGNAYEDQEGDENARLGLKYQEDALKMRRKLFPGNHLDVATSLNHVAGALKTLGGEANIRTALRYNKEALEMLEALFLVNHPAIAATFNSIGIGYKKLGGEENIKTALAYHKQALKMRKSVFPPNHYLIARSLDSIGSAYQELDGQKNIQKGLKYLRESLEMRKTQLPKNHPDIAISLEKLGIAYSKLEGKDNILKGLEYQEKALKMDQSLYPGNHSEVAKLFNNIGNTYKILGDENKALEYLKQAYSIYLRIFNEDYAQTKRIKTAIESLQPDFFVNQGVGQILQQQSCLGGNRVGSECRLIITSRGETNTSLLKLKEKIQESVLNNVVESVDKYGWSHEWFQYDWGVKGYIAKNYLGRKLEELENKEDNIKVVQILCFEAMNLGIMKSTKKPYEVVEGFTRDNAELVKKIAVEHPEFFVDGSIVEACIQAMPGDKEFEEHILKHVPYMGMQQRKGQRDAA